MNSNIERHQTWYRTSCPYGQSITINHPDGRFVRISGTRNGIGFCILVTDSASEQPIVIYNSGVLVGGFVSGSDIHLTMADSGYGSFVPILVEEF